MTRARECISQTGYENRHKCEEEDTAGDFNKTEKQQV